MDAFRPAKTLIRMVPEDKLDWRPGTSFMSLGQLIHHLSDGVGEGLRCLYTNQWPATPEQEKEAMKLENLPACSIEEALARLEKDEGILRDVLAAVSEEEFATKMLETPWGWKGKMEVLAVAFREHFTNHKMQLFLYLKLLGLPVDTTTLYYG